LGTSSSSFASGVNNSDQVVGQSAGHAFVWEDGVMTDSMPLPGRTGSGALGIDEIGPVVGWSTANGANGQHAVFWKRNRGVRDLGTLGGLTSRAYAIKLYRDSDSAAYAINESGLIVGRGQRRSSPPVVFSAVLWTPK
jgi:probable HAF family extracellular repeat protein